MIEQDPAFQRRARRLLETLRKKGIDDERVLRAIGAVPRHLFVEPGLRHRAYRDEALPIGMGQTISQPFTVAYQTMLLDVQEGDQVLEIGTGSGYQAAVLCAMGAQVFTIERHEPLLNHARAILRQVGCKVAARVGDGTLGWPLHAPYDAIIVTAGALKVPEALQSQLRVPPEAHQGGRLVIPVGSEMGQTMLRITRTGPDTYEREETFQFRFVPLIGEG